jgi:hypothetical protein
MLLSSGVLMMSLKANCSGGSATWAATWNTLPFKKIEPTPGAKHQTPIPSV